MVTAAGLLEVLPRDPEGTLPNATLFLDGLGRVVVAWRGLAQALARRHRARDTARRFLTSCGSTCDFTDKSLMRR